MKTEETENNEVIDTIRESIEMSITRQMTVVRLDIHPGLLEAINAAEEVWKDTVLWEKSRENFGRMIAISGYSSGERAWCIKIITR